MIEQPDQLFNEIGKNRGLLVALAESGSRSRADSRRKWNIEAGRKNGVEIAPELAERIFGFNLKENPVPKMLQMPDAPQQIELLQTNLKPCIPDESLPSPPSATIVFCDMTQGLRMPRSFSGVVEVEGKPGLQAFTTQWPNENFDAVHVACQVRRDAVPERQIGLTLASSVTRFTPMGAKCA